MKAGLSLSIDKNFNFYLKDVIKRKNQKYNHIAKHAEISERMFNYFLNNKIPSKCSLLAIATTLNLTLVETNELLSKAGYSLSNSILSDVIIKKIILNQKIKSSNKNNLEKINEILYELSLPLLMTREK